MDEIKRINEQDSENQSKRLKIDLVKETESEFNETDWINEIEWTDKTNA